MPQTRNRRQRAVARKKQQHVKQQLVGMQRKFLQALGIAIEEEGRSKYLAALLTYIVATEGVNGELVIDVAALDQFPQTARLQTVLKKETGQLHLIAITDEETEPQIEVVTPRIEVVSG